MKPSEHSAVWGIDRRSFIAGAAAAVALPFVGLGAISCNHRAAVGKTTSVGSWKTVIVSDNEPGQPLIVSGRILAPDQKTPLEGITLSVYQTDATGVYSTTGGNGDNRNTRIHGSMRTNSEGRYEFRTIKPGSYPKTRNPAHIHAFVSGPAYPEYWIDEYLFDDDPFVQDDVRRRSEGKGSFSPVLKLNRGSDGILRGERDIVIEKCGRNCTGR
jgi:protocatechuate 3,4-dioxygenase, beta subunit